MVQKDMTKNKIIEASWELLQQEGLESFSMRKLSKKLNLTVSSIYWHFASKEAIFQELIHQVIGEMNISLTQNTWQEQLLEYGYAISEVLRSRPYSAQLLMAYPPKAPNYLKLIDNLLKVIEHLDASHEYKFYTISVYLNYIINFEMDLMYLKLNSDKEDLLSAAERLKTSAPLLHQMKQEGIFNKLGHRNMFDYGLHVLINGFESNLT
ncbi:AcrR family transcriptional regulator [Pullulanibacillus pueri]|uniref:Transcriptional regulator n=1 Tax=Pullulanibacillus pueri TaxID=1437324 RepID=A0A8J2ZW39_9BACL|nr:TetR/AcrR family transcriptional regulator [Pullulanibacillus pueri]MBM7682661.1 AcrR family transcriptional regulator [Pullulanibacillus pueri]GGH82688.1 transcriptional regulator [Pullulanibacillus pueri]